MLSLYRLANLFIDVQGNTCTSAASRNLKADSLIRRLLTIMFAMLLWTVQTADAAVDHSKAFGGSDSATVMLVADQGGEGAGKVEGGLACNAGCICHVFHHACLGDLSASVVQQRVDGQAYVLADTRIGAFLTEPPTRPPLV